MMKHRKWFDISGKLKGMVFIVAFVLLFLGVSLKQNQVHIEGKSEEINSMSLSDDPYSDGQWYINNPGYYDTYLNRTKLEQSLEDVDMNVKEAWNSMKSYDKQEVVVAIIDTGVDYLHSDLSSDMWVNEAEIPGDNIDNDHNGYIDDINGWDFYHDDASICHYSYIEDKRVADSNDLDNHGTHIAGIIAAVADNKIGIAGIASNIDIKIMSLKINGGKNASGKMSDAIEAIQYASKMGADICNLSWGTTVYSEQLYEVMKESDMLFVAAAGNDGTDNDEIPLYPSSFKLDNIISVASISPDGEMSAYSNYGKESVDIAAPGSDIYSTVIGGYEMMSGSSMAAPQVTAVAALLYACNDELSASDAKELILNNIKPIEHLKGALRSPGIPDAEKVVLAAEKMKQDNAKAQLVVEEKDDNGEMNQSDLLTNEVQTSETLKVKDPDNTGLNDEVMTLLSNNDQIFCTSLNMQSNLAVPYERKTIFYHKCFKTYKGPNGLQTMVSFHLDG